NAPLSPFTLVLKLCVHHHAFDKDGSIQMMMRPIMEAGAIICQHTSSKPHGLLIRSLRMIEPIEGSDIVYRFLDNCFIRLSRRTAHYYEYIDEFYRAKHNAISNTSLNKLGLLPLIIMEQWPLFLGSATSSGFKTVTRWLILYCHLLVQKSGDSLLLQHILAQIKETTKDKDSQKLLKQAIKEIGTGSKIIELPDEELPSSTVMTAPTPDQVQAQPEVRQQVEFPEPLAEDENHPGLNKWRRMDVEEAVTTGAIGQLMLCFSSKHEEIRKQAMLGMQAFMSNLKLAQYSEKQQIYLLSGEFTETAQGLESGLPLPHFASVMAAKALLVLTNPLHPMYSKVNRFLTEGPVWMVDKLPLYWIHRIMYNTPTIDESHYKEVEWLLEIMADGLRTAATSNVGLPVTDERINQWSDGTIETALDVCVMATTAYTLIPPAVEKFSRVEFNNYKGTPPPTTKLLLMIPEIEDPLLIGAPREGPATVRDTNQDVPEDIVLGPPKTAFASASGARNSNRAFDSPSRTSFGVQPDDGKGDRHSLRERSSRQGQKVDVDGERLQESRNGNTRFRRGTNDHDPWYGRQERSLGTDENERGTHKGAIREQEKDRDNNRDTKNSRAHDTHRRDARETNGDTRRNGSARRHESAWHREGKETDNSEGRRNATRPRDWRDKEMGDTRVAEREWLPNVKSERDPEWMDELEVQEKKQTHTQEDFERWKERMKAGNIPSQEFDNATPQQGSDHQRNVSGISINEGKSKAETPLVVDQTFDGFFGLWNEPAKKAVTDIQELQAKDTRQSKAPKASKFTNFFGAPTPALARADPEEADELSTPDALKSSSSEDKEGRET
ncbi:MAG: hypothetical protein Q9214_004814, partial [Letrouitia sp. 1 TL-2023]